MCSSRSSWNLFIPSYPKNENSKTASRQRQGGNNKNREKKKKESANRATDLMRWGTDRKSSS